MAVHYRLVAEQDRSRVKAIVDDLLTSEQGALKVTLGKMVYELQPQIDWDKGKAVRHLLEALELDAADVVPLYVGDDITDEHAFEALYGRGIGIRVADPAGPGGRRPEHRRRSTRSGIRMRSRRSWTDWHEDGMNGERR